MRIPNSAAVYVLLGAKQKSSKGLFIYAVYKAWLMLWKSYFYLMIWHWSLAPWRIDRRLEIDKLNLRTVCLLVKIMGKIAKELFRRLSLTHVFTHKHSWYMLFIWIERTHDGFTLPVKPCKHLHDYICSIKRYYLDSWFVLHSSVYTLCR